MGTTRGVGVPLSGSLHILRSAGYGHRQRTQNKRKELRLSRLRLATYFQILQSNDKYHREPLCPKGG